MRSRRSSIRGLIDLAEGRWSDSERNLMRHAANSKVPLITYIAAARAAQMQEVPTNAATPTCDVPMNRYRRRIWRCCSRRRNCRSPTASTNMPWQRCGIRRSTIPSTPTV